VPVSETPPFAVGLAPAESVTKGWVDPEDCAKAGSVQRHAIESRAEIKECFKGMASSPEPDTTGFLKLRHEYTYIFEKMS
jgi:hypothetical protein